MICLSQLRHVACSCVLTVSIWHGTSTATRYTLHQIQNVFTYQSPVTHVQWRVRTQLRAVRSNNATVFLVAVLIPIFRNPWHTELCHTNIIDIFVFAYHMWLLRALHRGASLASVLLWANTHRHTEFVAFLYVVSNCKIDPSGQHRTVRSVAVMSNWTV